MPGYLLLAFIHWFFSPFLPLLYLVPTLWISSAYPYSLLLTFPPLKVTFAFSFVWCPVTCGAVGQWDPNCILRSFLWDVLSRHLQGPKFSFCPPLWKTDWHLVMGKARVPGARRKPRRRCPEPWWMKCGQASTRWGTRCRPIMFHWNSNKAPDSGSFPWDSPVGNWHRARISQQLVSPC